jgi:hypothetical protein
MRVYVCMYVCMCICMYVFVYVCMYVCRSIHTYGARDERLLRLAVYVCVCLYVYVCVSVCIMHTRTYIHTCVWKYAYVYGCVWGHTYTYAVHGNEPHLHMHVHISMHSRDLLTSCAHSYIHTHINTIYIHKRTYTRERMHPWALTVPATWIHTYIHTYHMSRIHTYITYILHTYIHACSSRAPPIPKKTFLSANLVMHLHTNQHACIHTYMEAYIHSRPLSADLDIRAIFGLENEVVFVPQLRLCIYIYIYIYIYIKYILWDFLRTTTAFIYIYIYIYIYYTYFEIFFVPQLRL